MADFSHISTADMVLFQQFWGQMDISLQHSFLSRLEELTQDNIELDFDAIFKFCLHDPDGGVRKRAIEGLWENEDTGLIRVFTEILKRDPSPEVQASAATALGRYVLLLELAQIGNEYRDFLSRILLHTFNDINRDIEVRRRSLEAAAPLTSADVHDAIRHAYDSHDERLVVSAVFSMGKTCNEAWLPVLYRELQNPDAEIRYEAAGALGEIGHEDAIPRLKEIIDDSDLEVRLAVIQSLGEIGGKEAKKILETLSNDPNEAIVEAVQTALTYLQNMDQLSMW